MEYTTDYEIYNPKLHNVIHPNLITNPYLGDISYNLDVNALAKYGLKGVSFCFFVKWNTNFTNGTMNPHIWIKKSLNIRNNGVINLKDRTFTKNFLSCEPITSVKEKTRFFHKNNLDLSYMIVKKVPVNNIPTDDVKVAIEFKYSFIGNLFYPKAISFGELKETINKYSGRSFKMGKPLNYYETELEKILSIDQSGQTAPFPGDCDLLLYDDDMKCKAIIEYKKRTQSGSNISIRNQSIINFRFRDTIKYKRLNILREYLEKQSNSDIPLLVLYYSTANDSDINKIKLESISHDLEAEKFDYFEFPKIKDIEANHTLIIDRILSFIS